MKYIRTKDGIIDLSKVNIGENGWESIEEYIAFKQEDQQEPIKHADTTEDLCDEFVYIDEKHGHLTYKQLCDWREDDIDFIKKGTTIYGAIWTEWGLKYVAKMNDKGELELL